MAAFNKINAFVADVCNKVHNLGSDALTICLTATANAPTTASLSLAGLTPIAYTNLTGNGTGTGGRTCTTTSCAQTAGTLKLILVNMIFTASGAVAAFGEVVLYNATAGASQLICWWAYGSDVTLASTETFTVAFDGTNGVLQLA